MGAVVLRVSFSLIRVPEEKTKEKRGSLSASDKTQPPGCCLPACSSMLLQPVRPRALQVRMPVVLNTSTASASTHKVSALYVCCSCEYPHYYPYAHSFYCMTATLHSNSRH